MRRRPCRLRFWAACAMRCASSACREMCIRDRPDSGLDAALGYSQQSGIPYGIGFLKNKYIGRTFIQPSQKLRENTVRIKLNPIADTVKGPVSYTHLMGLAFEHGHRGNVQCVAHARFKRRTVRTQIGRASCRERV